MKRFWQTVCSILLVLCAAFCVAACGETENGNGGGGGGGQQGGPTAAPEVIFEEASGELTLKNASGYTVVLLLNGQEYSVTGSSFFLADKVAHDGEYPFTVRFLRDGEIETEQSFLYFRESKQGEGEKEERVEVAFFAADESLIKRIFVEKGYQLTQQDYPLLPSQAGATYSWSVAHGSVATENLEIRVVAVYQEYTLTFVLNGGAQNGEIPSVYTVQQQVSLPSPTRDGYLFAGWYLAANFSGKPLTFVGGAGDTGNKTLYAKWAEITPEAQALLDALDASMAQKKVTVTYDGYEEALDISGATPYMHAKKGKEIRYVLTGGNYFDYAEKYYYAYERKVEILQVLPLEGIYGNLAEITPESGSGGVKSFLVKLKGDDTSEIRIKVKDGLVSYLGTKDGSQAYEVLYSVTKITPDTAEFEQKKKIFIQVLFDDKEDRDFEYLVAEDKTLADFPEIQDLIKSAQDFYAKGFFLDENLTQAVTNTSQVTGTVYFAYYSHQYLLETTPITLRHTCACSVCGGKTTDYQITFKEWNDRLREFKGSANLTADHEELLLRGFTPRVFDGYCLEGPFSKTGDEKEHPDGEYPFGYNEAYNLYAKAIEEGTPYGFVAEIFTRKREIATATLVLHMGSVVINHYISLENGFEIHDGFIYGYLPEGQIYYGWYADEEMTTPLEHHLGATDLREFYVKVGEDTRKEITVHLGVKKGSLQLVEEYYRQGQEHLQEEEYFGPTQTVKFFEDTQLLKILQNSGVSYMGDESMGDKQVAGYYLDAAFTKPVTAETKVSEVTDIYVKWGNRISFTLRFFTGDSQEGEGFDGAPIMGVVEDWRMHSITDGCRSVYKFYADEGRTQEIIGLKAGDIFVGYEPLPTVTLVCADGCQAQVHSARATGNYLQESWFYEDGIFGLHGFYIEGTDEFNRYDIYLDAAYTRPVFGMEENVYLETDLIVYAKPEKPLRETTLHCGCLTHGENGFKVAFYNETQLFAIVDKNCDFGKYLPHKSFYTDAERKEWFDSNAEGTGKDGLWLQKLTKVKVGIQGQEAFPIFVESLYEIMYFYEQAPIENSGDKAETTEPTNENCYALYEDDTYARVRILPIDYPFVENEIFYFKKVSSGEFTVTLISADYGEKSLTGWGGELKDSQVQVYKKAFSESGMLVKAYYYDAALTDLAMKANENYYLNQSVTLYAELTTMPKMTIHYNHYGATDEEGTVYELSEEESYSEILWREFGFGHEYPFAEGYSYELCENADGTGVVDINKTAEEGEYYFFKNEYSKNNIKITLEGIANEGDIKDGGDGWRKIGQGNYFYLQKGSDYQAVLKALYGAYNAGVRLSNGQVFRLSSSLVDCLEDEKGVKVFKKSEILKIYTDAAMTKALAQNATLSEDTTLYFTIDVTGLEKHTVYLGNKGTFVFYTGDLGGGMSDDGTYRLLEFFRSSHGEWIDKDMLAKYPDLFQYGAVVETYIDQEYTQRFEGYEAPARLYARVQEFYSAKVYFADGGLFLSYAAFTKKSLNDLRPDFKENPKNYGVDKPGHIPYLAADKEGKTEVAFSDGLSGEYYICYRRDGGSAEIVVGGWSCSCDSDHSYDFWDWSNKDGAEGDGGTLLGTMQKFYIKKGGSLQTFIDAVKETHAEWRNDGDGSGDYIVYPTVTLYADKEMTVEITDLTVTEDRTIFVKVLFE